VLLLRLFATAIAFVVATVDTVVMGSLGTIAGVFDRSGDLTRNLARFWARVALLGAFVRVRVEGAAQVQRDAVVVYMSNHESWLDIPALMVAVPGQVRFLAKKSLFSVPFLGWAMHAMGFIPVDREHRATAVRSFEAAAERIRSGRSVLLFPEETRTVDGSLLPFQRGGFLIALKAGLPIAPVGLEGARRCMPKHSYLLRPGTIVVRFGALVPTAGLGVRAKNELMERARRDIDRLRGGIAAAEVTA
jgi:1-acyl-sn-glycerol-3-phosphate acyltransferase